MSARGTDLRAELPEEQRAAAVWHEHLDARGVRWAGATILDFGCGGGYLLQLLIDQAGVREAHGIDLSPTRQASLDASGPQAARGVHLHAGDLRTIKAVQPLHFDIIVTIDAFPLLQPSELMEVLLWCYDHLKPGGQMFTVMGTFTSADGAGIANATFPHAHLLFGQEEIDASLAQDALPLPYANPSCAATYLLQYVRAGFEIVTVDRQDDELDVSLLIDHHAKLKWLDEDELRASRLCARLRRPLSPNLAIVDRDTVRD